MNAGRSYLEHTEAPVAELGRQSNTPTLLLGHARDEVVAATGCTNKTAEETLRLGLERHRLEWTHGPIEGRLPPGVTDVASHLFSQKTADEKLEYDFANNNITRSGPDYSYTVLNVRIERVSLMTWCREANLLLAEALLAPPFELSSAEFARPALTRQHALRAESFSVGALDFATPVLTVREAPKPSETPDPVAEPIAAPPVEPASTPVAEPEPTAMAEPVEAPAADLAEPAAVDPKIVKGDEAISLLKTLMRKHRQRRGEQPGDWAERIHLLITTGPVRVTWKPQTTTREMRKIRHAPDDRSYSVETPDQKIF
jgi:hypothetical protein